VIAKGIQVNQAPGGGSNFNFSGNLEKAPNTTGRLGDWKVAGTIVHVTATTFIKQEDAPVAIGAGVGVEGARRADGSVDAFENEIKSNPSAAGVTRLFEFQGAIESLPSTPGRIGQWAVGGRKVNVTASAHIKPNNAAVAIGFLVQVKGMLQQDDSIDATEIE